MRSAPRYDLRDHRGIGASSDGNSKNVYAPRSKAKQKPSDVHGQRPAAAWNDVEMIEAHGTETKPVTLRICGPPTGIAASLRKDRGRCALGSIKAQIGHTKSAAGADGCFKCVMALHHAVLRDDQSRSYRILSYTSTRVRSI